MFCSRVNFACFIIKQNNWFIAFLSRKRDQVFEKVEFVYDLYKHATKNYMTVATKCHSFTTTDLDRGEWPISRSDRFIPENTSEYHLKRWLDRRRDEQQTQSPPGWAPTAQSPRFNDSRRELSFPYLLVSLPKVQRPHRPFLTIVQRLLLTHDKRVVVTWFAVEWQRLTNMQGINICYAANTIRPTTNVN